MISLLSGYWAPTHDQKPYLDYYRKLQPADILILQPDVQQISDAYQASPESTITLRRWDWDDNRGEGNPGIYPHLQHDPEGYARWLVEQYAIWVPELEQQARQRGIPFPAREQLVAHHVNEPDTNYLLPQINRTTVVAAKLFRERLGMGCDMLNIGTGQPALLNAQGEPDWSPLAEALDACVRYDCPAVTHEYMNDLPMTDPSIYPWHIGRHAKWAPRGPNWKIGEFGLEMLVNNRRDGHHGWQGIVSEDEMIRRTALYLDSLRDDVIAARWYMDDYADRIWRTFDSKPLHDRLIVLGWRYPSKGRAASQPAAQPEHKAHIPVVTVGTPPQAPTAEPEQPQPEPPVPVAVGIIDPLTALAFLQVESGNQPFIGGLLTIRFEVHRFEHFLGNQALFNHHFKYTPRAYNDQWWRPQPTAEWRHAHGPMAQRHELLRFARSLDDTAALNSTGMGMAQIMGHNAQRVGYPSPQAMFNAFRHERYGVNAQIMGFVNYVLSDARLTAALRRRDWFASVQLYNGIGQEAEYTRRLNRALQDIGQAVRG